MSRAALIRAWNHPITPAVFFLAAVAAAVKGAPDLLVGLPAFLLFIWAAFNPLVPPSHAASAARKVIEDDGVLGARLVKVEGGGIVSKRVRSSWGYGMEFRQAIAGWERLFRRARGYDVIVRYVRPDGGEGVLRTYAELKAHYLPVFDCGCEAVAVAKVSALSGEVEEVVYLVPRGGVARVESVELRPA